QYSQPNFGGPCTTFKQSDPDLSDDGIGNDNTRSVQIVGPYTGSLFLDPSYQGHSVSFNENISDMQGSVIGSGESSLNVAVSGPRTISVPQNYPTISEAMEVAQAGDTILVAEGTYHEKFSVKSGVKLIGAGAATTTIRGDGVGVVVHVGGSAELSG